MPPRLFDAWTDPIQLQKWWGPRPVTCAKAEVDLRVGGEYRIANQLADGSLLWISGEFERITPPHLLVFTWRVGAGESAASPQRVTVRFEPRDGDTEVTVVHENIADEPTRRSHQGGWVGCLEGLERHFD